MQTHSNATQQSQHPALLHSAVLTHSITAQWSEQAASCLSAAAAAAAAASQAGTVTFSGQVVYSSYEQWLADADKHCVAPGTPYSWQPGGTHFQFFDLIVTINFVQHKVRCLARAAHTKQCHLPKPLVGTVGLQGDAHSWPMLQWQQQ
jgi:hypothetical protein